MLGARASALACPEGPPVCGAPVTPTLIAVPLFFALQDCVVVPFEFCVPRALEIEGFRLPLGPGFFRRGAPGL